jgi:hypothetical protein
MILKKNNAKILEYQNAPDAPKGAVQPIGNNLPEWWFKAKRFLEDEANTPGIKKCVPFLDALTTGYFMVLTQELFVEQTPDGPVIRCKHEPSPVASRAPSSSAPMPPPPGYDEEHFIWQTLAAIHIPEGYSAIFTHPLNRFELPFITLTGVVDGDFYMHGGNIPFHIKKDFEGIIPEGTPIMQIIPFLREEWVLERSKHAWNIASLNTMSEDYSAGSWYRRNKWKKKSFR